MSDLHIFLLVLSLNTVISLFYLLWNILWFKGRMEGYLIRTIVMVLCPVVGPVCIFFRWLWFNTLFHREVDLSDVVFSKERVKAAARADEERERNIAPIEEAIVVTDRRNLRELMLNVVRGDIKDSIASIALALESEDSEISHYAASVLQGALNEFRSKVQKNYQMLQEHVEDDTEDVLVDDIIDDMNAILEKEVLTGMEQYHYTMMMDEIGELFYEREKERMDTRTFEYLCLRLLKVEEYDKCEKWCGRLEKIYPDMLAAYTCQLKLYFSKGDKAKFFEVMERLKRSDIVIDKDTLELIRVFS